MKLQLTLVTLAVLYGSVTATPIPVDDAFPSIVSTGLNAAGQGLSDLFQLFAPADTLNGALQAADACQRRGNQLFCPQSRDVQEEEAFPSIVSTGLNAAGQGLSDLFQLFAPSDALGGALQAADACQVRGNQLFCPRDVQDEEAFPSLVSTGLNAVGQGLSDAFQLLAPTDALNGALQAANACQVRGGQLFCPQSRDVQDEEAFPSLVSTGLNAIGQGLSDAFQFLAPSDTLSGGLQAADACQVRGNQLFCPRDVQDEEAFPSLVSTGLNAVGQGLSNAFQLLAPTDALNGALQAANACQVRGNQIFCPRDVQEEEAFPSIVGTGLNAIGQGLSDAFQLLAPTDALNGALQAANACQVRNGQVFCPSS